MEFRKRALRHISCEVGIMKKRLPVWQAEAILPQQFAVAESSVSQFPAKKEEWGKPPSPST